MIHVCAVLYFTQAPTCSHHIADRGELHEGVVVGQDGVHGQLVHAAADVRFLREMAKTGHGHKHGLSIRTPQESVQTHLKLGLSLSADGNETALCSTLL